MKTASTKLSKEDFAKFQEMCNSEGQCMSEEIRDLIKMGIDSYEEGPEMEKEEKPHTKENPKPVIELIEDTPKEPVVSHGEILDDKDNVIGTF